MIEKEVYIRRLTISLGLLAVAFVTACASPQPADAVELPTALSVEVDETSLSIDQGLIGDFPDGADITITSAFDKYTQAYGCGATEIETKSATLPIIYQGQIVELSEPGLITMDYEAILAQEIDWQLFLTQIIEHSLTHACKPDEVLMLEENLVLNDQLSVVGFQGFSLIVENKRGQRAKISLIEEGVAEVLATKLDEAYQSHSPGYLEVGSLTILVLDELMSGDANRLAELVQTSGLSEYIGIILDKDSPTNEDLKLVLNWYIRTAEGDRVAVQDEIVSARQQP